MNIIRDKIKELELNCIEAKNQYDTCKSKVEETQTHQSYAALKTALDKWEQTTIELEQAQSELLKVRDYGSK